MSTRIKTLLFIGLTAAARGQTGFGFDGHVLDASNSEMTWSSSRSLLSPPADAQPVSVGSISVRQLERPLEGKPLRLLKKAQELLQHGDFAKASERLHEAMKIPEAEPYALSMLAAEHLKRNEFDSAVPMLQSALNMVPGVAANHSNLAWALSVQGHNAEALKEARRATQLDPGHARYRYVLGVILLRLHQMEEAEFHLQKASKEIHAAGDMLEQYFKP